MPLLFDLVVYGQRSRSIGNSDNMFVHESHRCHFYSVLLPMCFNVYIDTCYLHVMSYHYIYIMLQVQPLGPAEIRQSLWYITNVQLNYHSWLALFVLSPNIALRLNIKNLIYVWIIYCRFTVTRSHKIWYLWIISLNLFQLHTPRNVAMTR